MAALFAKPYANQIVESRGCSDEFPPVYCSYGPPGGGSGALYELYVTQTAHGWYVSRVLVEG